jgi:hypothetical protein
MFIELDLLNVIAVKKCTVPASQMNVIAALYTICLVRCCHHQVNGTMTTDMIALVHRIITKIIKEELL